MVRVQLLATQVADLDRAGGRRRRRGLAAARPGQPAKAGDHLGLTARRDACVERLAHRLSATLGGPEPASSGTGSSSSRSSSSERPARGRKKRRSQLAQRSVPSSSSASPSDAPQPAQESRKASRLPSARATASRVPSTSIRVSSFSASPSTPSTSIHADGASRARGDLDDRELGRARAWRRRRRRDRALDHEALEVGRRGVERRLDRQLERRGRRRAALAAALEPDPRDPALDPEQLDVAAVRLHVRAHRVERVGDALVERRPDRGRGSASGWRRRRRRRAGRRAPAPRRSRRSRRRSARAPRRRAR